MYIYLQLQLPIRGVLTFFFLKTPAEFMLCMMNGPNKEIKNDLEKHIFALTLNISELFKHFGNMRFCYNSDDTNNFM